MTTTRKKGLTWGLTVLGLALACGTAWAGNHEGSVFGSDEIVVNITPNALYGVSIDTTNVTLNLGSLNLGTTAFTASPATVTILGNIAYGGAGNGGQELDLGGALTASSGAPWTFDPAPTTGSQSGTQDKLAMYLLFSNTGLSTVPSGTDFGNATANAAITQSGVTFYHAGSRAGTGSQFVDQTSDGGTALMDNMSATNKRHMWLWFRLPSATSNAAQENVTLTLTAKAGT